MGFKDKVFKNKGGDKSKVDSPINDADDVAQEYVKLEVIKKVRQERKEKRSSQSSGRSSKGSSVASQAPSSDKNSGASQQPKNSDKNSGATQNSTNADKTSGASQQQTSADKISGANPEPNNSKIRLDSQTVKPYKYVQDEQVSRYKKTSANINSDMSFGQSDMSSFESKGDFGTSEEEIKVSIREKYLSGDAGAKQKKRRRWSWGDGFTRRFVNAIRKASRKVFRKRATVESADNQRVGLEDGSSDVGGKPTPSEGDDRSVMTQESSGSESWKRKRPGFFARWRQKMKKKKKTKNEDDEKPKKTKTNFFLFLKRRKTKSEEPPPDNRADWAAMT